MHHALARVVTDLAMEAGAGRHGYDGDVPRDRVQLVAAEL
jgi:hypothetical protein